MKRLSSAGIVLFRMKGNQREYLLLHYPHGHWDLPKGKIEKGESKQEAALRELHEEAGLTAKILDGFEEQFFYFFKQDGELMHKTVYFFIGKAEPGDIKLSHEHIGFAWLSFDEALERLSFKNAKELLKKVDIFLNQ